MMDLFKLFLHVLASLFKSRVELEAENLILRQHVNVLRRQAPKRTHLHNTDRLLFVWLHRWFPSLSLLKTPKAKEILEFLRHSEF
jgi:hypothetical protein